LHALAEGSLTNAFKSLLEASERLPSSSRFEGTRLPFIFCGGLIGSIRMLDGTRPYLLLGIGDDAFRFCNLSFENPLVMFDCALRRQAADLDTLGLLCYRVVEFMTRPTRCPVDAYVMGGKTDE
jgi:hypothetical protein